MYPRSVGSRRKLGALKLRLGLAALHLMKGRLCSSRLYLNRITSIVSKVFSSTSTGNTRRRDDEIVPPPQRESRLGRVPHHSRVSGKRRQL